jgi:hypothetical protein
MKRKLVISGGRGGLYRPDARLEVRFNLEFAGVPDEPLH